MRAPTAPCCGAGGSCCGPSCCADFAGVARGAPPQRATGSRSGSPQRAARPARHHRATATPSPCAAAPASASASSAPATGSGSSSTAASRARSTSTVVQRGPFQNAYVGYWIDEEQAGQGYMPEALVVAGPLRLRGAAPAPDADRDHPPQHGQPPGRREARHPRGGRGGRATSRSTACGRTTSATPSPSRSGSSAATSCSTPGCGECDGFGRHAPAARP